MPIEQLDVIPSRYRPTTFTPDMEAFLAWIQRNVPNYNSLEQSLQLVATTGTSSSTLTVGTGVRNLTASPGRAWVVGAFVYVVHAASPANFMVGQITAYNSGTGALTLNVLRAAGSGTYGAWLIGLSGGDGTVVPRTGDTGLSGNYTTSGTWTGQHALPTENAYWSWNSVADSVIYNADANDFMQYSRLLDAWAWFVNGENRLYVDQYGPGRNDDASTPNGLVRKSQVDAELYGRLMGVQVFASSGVYTPSAGMRFCIVKMAGGGGSGGGGSVGGSTALGGSGGGAGATATGRFTAAQVGPSLTVTIGAGGAASVSGPGNSGGTTSFGALLSCAGGSGGNYTVSGGIIQTASGADGGAPYGDSLFSSSGGGGGSALAGYNSGNYLIGFGGAGGGNEFGGGGRAGSSASVAAGGPGGGYGCGGGGAGVASGSAQSGAGRAGVVIVYEYA